MQGVINMGEIRMRNTHTPNPMTVWKPLWEETGARRVQSLMKKERHRISPSVSAAGNHDVHLPTLRVTWPLLKHTCG